MDTPSDRKYPLAVICGASEWPRLAQFSSSQAFANTANRVRGYLTGATGLELSDENVLWLFNSSDNSISQLDQVAEFLRERFDHFGTPHGVGSTVFFVYVGHGTLLGSDQAYHLLLRDTHEPLLAASSLRVADIAHTLRTCAPRSSRFVILDACFAGTAFKYFQSDIQQIAQQRLESEIAGEDRSGVALLCATSARNPARLEKAGYSTLFGNALLQVLENGDPDTPGPMSLDRVCHLTREVLSAYEDAPYPEMHAPDQKAGNLTQLPLFPNPAVGGSSAVLESAPTVVSSDQSQSTRIQTREQDRHEDALKVAMATLEDAARIAHENLIDITKSIVVSYELLRRQLDFEGLELALADGMTINLAGLSIEHRRAILMWTAQDKLRTHLQEASTMMYSLVSFRLARPIDLRNFWDEVMGDLEERQKNNPGDPLMLKRMLVFKQIDPTEGFDPE
ncbi:caspase family protein [Nocardia sp. XZ_19_369]|uniref:caspase family protein n=1 Tax=Nocardia sp. XZ_19_369 TaxID=2769487 RepID=UPI00188EC34C|nr:caspase family protein [Nocardia sp. XZ_19_369]